MIGFFEAFLFGTFWFWTLSLIFLIVAISLTENESGFWALVTLTIYLLYFQLLAKIDFFGWILKNPINFLIAIGCYLIIGLIWSCIKWWLLVSHIAEIKKDTWEKFLKKHNLPKDTKTLPERLFNDWSTTGYQKPLFSDNKNKITLWVTYWPLSMIWSLIRDLITKIIKQIVIRFQKVYEKITNNAFKDLDSITTEKKGLKNKN